MQGPEEGLQAALEVGLGLLEMDLESQVTKQVGCKVCDFFPPAFHHPQV